jgi:hypothetical protein
MKKTLIYSAIIFLLISCVSDVKTGIPFESISIEMSRENKVIKSVYHPSISQIDNNGKSIKIIEVWSENSWCYKDTERNIEKLKNINFIIRFDKENEELNNLKCARVGKLFSGIGTRNNNIFTELTYSEHLKDTLVFLFQSDKGTIPIKFTKIK